MADIIYKDAEGAFQIGSDSDGEQLAAAVYRSVSTKEIVLRDGCYSEVSADGSSRQLFTGGARIV